MTTEPTEHERAFATYLARLRDEHRPGALPTLRRGLGRGATPPIEVYAWVVPWLGEGGSWSDECHFEVAAMFSVHRLDWPPPAEDAPPQARNLGASLRRIAETEVYAERRLGKALAAERRLGKALAAERGALMGHLRPLVNLLARRGVPIDWAQLLHDTLRWGDMTRREWARAYYRRDDETEEASVVR
jgi:CRISPR type I-E-associated protein CasB/Cse2